MDSCLSLLAGEVLPDWTESRADILTNKQKSQELVLFHLATLTQAATDTNNIILVILLVFVLWPCY